MLPNEPEVKLRFSIQGQTSKAGQNGDDRGGAFHASFSFEIFWTSYAKEPGSLGLGALGRLLFTFGANLV